MPLCEGSKRTIRNESRDASPVVQPEDFLLAPIQQATHPVVLSLVCEQISGDGSNTHRTRDFSCTADAPRTPKPPPGCFGSTQGP